MYVGGNVHFTVTPPSSCSRRGRYRWCCPVRKWWTDVPWGYNPGLRLPNRVMPVMFQDRTSHGILDVSCDLGFSGYVPGKTTYFPFPAAPCTKPGVGEWYAGLHSYIAVMFDVRLLSRTTSNTCHLDFCCRQLHEILLTGDGVAWHLFVLNVQGAVPDIFQVLLPWIIQESVCLLRSAGRSLLLRQAGWIR